MLTFVQTEQFVLLTERNTWYLPVIVAIVVSVKNPESEWQKVDYLMEFGEWLFVNEYPVADALDQVSEP